MNVCITGGTGYIGTLLTQRLRRQSALVRIVSRRKALNDSAIFTADLADPAVILQGLLDGVDVILHCAGETLDQSQMRALHVDGMQRLLDAARAHIAASGQPLHWVQLSSVGAYGPGQPGKERIVTEETAPAPVGNYEVTKTLADQMLIEFAQDQPLFSYTIVRPSIVISASMKNQSVRALLRFIRKRLFFFIGMGDAIATYVHADDVVEVMLLCATDLRARGQIFNLSNDCLWREIVDAVAVQSGIRPPTLRVPEFPLRLAVWLAGLFFTPPLSIERINALVSKTRYPNLKLKQFLGFSPAHAIPQSMAGMFNE